jgi:RecQ family ATP-dependent DNA helicase
MDPYEKKNRKKTLYKSSLEVLEEEFGYTQFRPNQFKIIHSILKNKDVLAVLPTGYGKSLCFQLPPLISNQLGIVIAPLIALMQDQKNILDDLGIPSCCYNSTLNMKQKKEMENDLINGKYKILYITPESLINSYELIEQIEENYGICMIAIDEAHCVSSYGNDFRPKYRKIHKLRDSFPSIPLLAVTASATKRVIKDIQTTLKMKKNILIKSSFDRPNLNINITMRNQHTTKNIIAIINNILKEKTGSVIIYCITRKETEKISTILNKNNIDSKPYNAGFSDKERKKTQDGFMNSEYRVICATMAFGMGVNKSDIRSVIHIGLPQNIEAYYQEIGRAGRDGKPSECHMFYSNSDYMTQKRMITSTKDEDYRKIKKDMLYKMSKYISSKLCRRVLLLNYFDMELEDTYQCMNCDICLKEDVKLDSEDKKKLLIVLNLINEIQTVKGYSYGLSTIALILKGSKSKKIQKWMIGLKYYSGLDYMTSKDLTNFIKKMMEEEYIENKDIGNCCHVLNVSKKGNKLFSDKSITKTIIKSR